MRTCQAGISSNCRKAGCRSGRARSSRNRGEIAAGTVAADGDARRIGAQLTGIALCPAPGCQRVVQRRRIGRFRRQAIFDPNHDLPGGIGQGAAERFIGRQRSQAPPAAMQIDDGRQAVAMAEVTRTDHSQARHAAFGRQDMKDALDRLQLGQELAAIEIVAVAHGADRRIRRRRHAYARISMTLRGGMQRAGSLWTRARREEWVLNAHGDSSGQDRRERLLSTLLLDPPYSLPPAPLFWPPSAPTASRCGR